MAPGPGAILARTGAHGAPAGGRHLQLHLVAAPGRVVRGADALALVAILQHADGNRAGKRRARIEHLASVNVAGHGRNINLVDVRMLPRIHIAVPAPQL